MRHSVIELSLRESVVYMLTLEVTSIN